MKDENTRRVSDLPLDAFDPAPAGVAVFSGSDHRLIYMNDACQEIVGERPLGSPARLGSSIAAERDRFLQRFQSLIQLERQEIWVTDPWGEVIELSPGWQRFTGQP